MTTFGAYLCPVCSIWQFFIQFDPNSFLLYQNSNIFGFLHTHRQNPRQTISNWEIPTFLSLPSKYTFSVTFVLIPPFFLSRRNIRTWDPSIPSGGQLHTVHVQRVRESHFTFHSMDQRFYQCLFSPCIRVKSTFSGLKHFLWGIKSTLVIFLLPISRKNQQAK